MLHTVQSQAYSRVAELHIDQSRICSGGMRRLHSSSPIREVITWGEVRQGESDGRRRSRPAGRPRAGAMQSSWCGRLTWAPGGPGRPGTTTVVQLVSNGSSGEKLGGPGGPGSPRSPRAPITPTPISPLAPATPGRPDGPWSIQVRPSGTRLAAIPRHPTSGRPRPRCTELVTELPRGCCPAAAAAAAAAAAGADAAARG